MKYKLVIFDLDGTLLNTINDLTNSINYSLNKYKYPLKTIKEIKSYLGNGIKKLVERSLPNLDNFDNVYNTFLNHYQNNYNIETKPYENIKEVLNYLKNNNYKLAVISNKKNEITNKLINNHFPHIFDIILGEVENLKKKPNPDMVNYVLNELKINKEDTIYIGDSEVDMKVSLNSNIDYILVSYGYRDKEFLLNLNPLNIVDNPKDIIKVIE